MKIILATPQDLDAIMEMYNSCVQGMLALGIEQWDESYPNRTIIEQDLNCLLYTSPSPRDLSTSRMPSSA